MIPAVLGVELLAAFPKVPRWLIWPLRLVIVAGGARVLLHGSGYITDLTGPATSEWSPAQTWLIFSGLAAIEAVVWVCLALLARRAPGPSVPLSLAIVDRGIGRDGHAFGLFHGRTGWATARGCSCGIDCRRGTLAAIIT